MHRLTLAFTVLVAVSVVASGCAKVNTLPKPIGPDDPVRRYQLAIPDSIEVLSVDFDIAIYGGEGVIDKGRAFVKVVGRVRTSGRFVLFLFENLDRRQQPIEVIEIVSGTGS